jgi:RNA polymerase sigma-70 factor (ECF subfamily)
MSTASPFDTKPSLILKLRNSSRQEEVQPEFVKRYGSLVYAWCLRWGAPPQDAEDIVQQTLLKVFLKIDGFEKKGPGTFRAWMRRIARNVWLKIVEKTLSQRKILGELAEFRHDLKPLRSGAARDDLLKTFDELACEEIRLLAFESVRMRVRTQSWDAFLLCDHERLPGKVVAQRLGISLKAVHLAAIRVRKLLNEELRRIDPTWIDSRRPVRSTLKLADESLWKSNDPNALSRSDS